MWGGSVGSPIIPVQAGRVQLSSAITGSMWGWLWRLGSRGWITSERLRHINLTTYCCPVDHWYYTSVGILLLYWQPFSRGISPSYEYILHESRKIFYTPYSVRNVHASRAMEVSCVICRLQRKMSFVEISTISISQRDARLSNICFRDYTRRYE